MHRLHEDAWLQAGEQFTILMSPHSPTTLWMNLLFSTNVFSILLQFLSIPFPLLACNLQKRHITVPSIVWDGKPRAVRRNRGSLPGDLWHERHGKPVRRYLCSVQNACHGVWVQQGCQARLSDGVLGLTNVALPLGHPKNTTHTLSADSAVSFHVCRIWRNWD